MTAPGWWGRLAIDRATLSGVAARLLSVVGGPVSMLLIARHLSAAEQGYYYTFSSLVALQSFFELGLYIVIINLASHEWAGLALDREGRVVANGTPPGRLAAMLGLLVRWYGVAAFAFLVGAGVIGWVFLAGARGAADGDVAWRGPWPVLVAITAATLVVLPLKSILEGCGQVGTVNAYRVVNVVLSYVGSWSALAAGAGLWALVASSAAMLAVDLALLRRYRRFFASLRAVPADPGFRWRTDVWPMQWRLALQGVLFYFAYSLFTPVVFRYHGAAEAGRMGMTWQMALALQGVGTAWVAARVPTFGHLIAAGARAELDALWRRVALVSTGVTVAGAIAGVALATTLGWLDHPFASRLLPPAQVALLLSGAVAAQGIQCFAAWLRAHRTDPLAGLGVVVSSALGAAIWFGGQRFGSGGAAWGYALVMWGVSLPGSWWIWRRWRARVAPGRVPAVG